MDQVYEAGEKAKPSRLGPWPKACDVCALRNSDPLDIGKDTQNDIRESVGHKILSFYCLHRTTEAGRHRECACAAAIAKGAENHRKRKKDKEAK